MAKYDMENETVANGGVVDDGVVEEREFDINDPEIDGSWTPESDEAVDQEPDYVMPEPPEGNVMVRVTLREPKEGKPSIKKFGSKKGRPPGVQATCGVQHVTWDAESEDWLGGQFLKDFYPATVTYLDSETMPKLNIVMKRAGKPFGTRMSLDEKMAHVQQVFDEAGEAGVLVPAFVRWIKSEPRLDEDGEQIVDSEGKKQYDEIKGSKKIRAQAVAAAKRQAVEEGLVGDDYQKAIESAKRKAHMYLDDEGEMRTVRSEVDRLLSIDEWERFVVAQARKAAKAAGE